MRDFITGLLMAFLLAGCSAAQIQKAADAITAMERNVCLQIPMAIVAAKVARAGALELQKAQPGDDAEKAVAAGNLTVASLDQVQAFCSAKGYK